MLCPHGVPCRETVGNVLGSYLPALGISIPNSRGIKTAMSIRLDKIFEFGRVAGTGCGGNFSERSIAHHARYVETRQKGVPFVRFHQR